MPVLSWYWNRLRAMEPGELSKHIKRKLWQLRSGESRPWDKALGANPDVFPLLPDPAAAPDALRQHLAVDSEEILAGRWTVFGGIQLQVDDPPCWHKDYLAGLDVTTDRPARDLDHRELPHGADIKLLWELSRWNHLVRLAQAAYVLGDERIARKCLEWLQDWVKHNPPFRGWNWTSALESGLRLIQFAWIDALLCRSSGLSTHLEELRRAILPAHVRFTWHCRTFGSSANNHLLGELTGLIAALARWPALEKCATTLDGLQAHWEDEVLAQFWEDGGNKEQALHYQLFSWDLCWTARLALIAARRPINQIVEERITSAANFYDQVQAPADPWDYGDSDDARVTPVFTSGENALKEWRAWLKGPPGNTAYQFWLGPPPNVRKRPHSYTTSARDWAIYPKTGIATCQAGPWFLRWDLSPLGYLKPAAHGHLDALHLSLWYRDMALVIDPGTGAYYADPALRTWLASRESHNGPCMDSADQPKRLGPFLWSHHHPRPEFRSSESSLDAEVFLGANRVRRLIQRAAEGDGWQITDSVERPAGAFHMFTVHWQFAPGVSIESVSERRFQVRCREASMIVDVDTSWTDVAVQRDAPPPPTLAGVVSPSFRKTTFAPYLRLSARLDDKPCVFRTTFLACEVR